jgi:hypothetical protein
MLLGESNVRSGSGLLNITASTHVQSYVTLLKYQTVFRIREILRRRRRQIRILGYVDWIKGPDPALFFNGFQDATKKLFCLLLTVSTFTLLFNNNMS